MRREVGAQGSQRLFSEFIRRLRWRWGTARHVPHLQNVPAHAENGSPRSALQVHATRPYLFWPEPGTQHARRCPPGLPPQPWLSNARFPCHTAGSSNKPHTRVVPGRSFQAYNICGTWRFPAWRIRHNQKSHVKDPKHETVPKALPNPFFCWRNARGQTRLQT